jgi:hypothetical protein
VATATGISLTVADSFASIASTVPYTYTTVTNCRPTDASLDGCAVKDANSPCVLAQQGAATVVCHRPSLGKYFIVSSFIFYNRNYYSLLFFLY